MDTFGPSDAGLATSIMHVHEAASQWGGTIFSLRRSGRRQRIHQRTGWLWVNGEDRPRSIGSFVKSIVKRQKRLARKIETARRHVREGEVRLARQEAIVSELETHNHSRAAATGRDALDTMGDTPYRAKQHPW